MKVYWSMLFFLSVFYSVQAQNHIIEGKVSSNGQPVSSVSVKIKGTSFGTGSDTTGHYKLENVPAGKRIIVFSAVGFHTLEISLDINQPGKITLDAKLTASASTLNEVVVTGASRATEVRKSPIPVAVMTKKMMDQHVNNNLIDAIVKGVPGVTAVTTGPNVSKPFIRGLGYNRVLTLYDGIRQEGQQWGDEHGIEIDQFGISRAEVVKGPASLTYGSDALAGVINMIPYVPAYENHQLVGDYTADYHTNNDLIATSLGLGYRKDSWKYMFRISGKQAFSYSDKIDGVVYGTAFKEYNLSASARVDKNWGYSKLAVTVYDNQQEIPDGSRDSLTRRFTRQVLDDGDDIKDRPIVAEKDLRSYSINPLHQHIQHYRIYDNSEFKVGQGSLDVQLAGQQSIRREYNHPTVAEQAGLYVVLNTFSYGLKYNLPTYGGWETTVGAGGMYQSNRSRNATDFPIPDYNLFDLGGYVFSKKSFGKLDVAGGIRLDHRNVHWKDFYVGTNLSTGFSEKVGPSASDAVLQFPSFNHVYHGLSGNLGVTYNITEQLLLKGNIARGYRAPNITEIGSNGLDPGAHIVYLGNRNFKPEFNLQEDLGLVAYLKDVDMSVELFNNAVENYIYQARLTDEFANPVVIVPGNLTYQYQQSKARLYGAEVTMNIHPEKWSWFNFNNSLAYVQGLNKNKTLLAKYGAVAKYLPFIPPFHLRSGIKLTAKESWGNFDKPYFSVDANIYAAQNHFYALDNTETATPGYTLIDASIGTTLKNKKQQSLCEFFIQVENLFDIAYQSNLNRLKYFEYYSSSPNGRSGIYNMGRNVSLKIIVPFN